MTHPTPPPPEDDLDAEFRELALSLGAMVTPAELADRVRRKILREITPPAAAVRVPRLTPRSIRRYIGAVAQGTQTGQITPAAATAMLYAAQLLLAASRLPPAPRRGQRQPVTLEAEPAPRTIASLDAAGDWWAQMRRARAGNRAAGK